MNSGQQGIAPRRPPTVSIQGYLGSFHHIAAEQLVGVNANIQERELFKEVFEDVASGLVEYGVVATTNSLYGEIREVTQLIQEYPTLQVIRHLALPIQQNVIVVPGTALNAIREVHSQLPALEQCREFLSAHPNIKTVETTDTALSVVAMMRRADRSIAAIASTRAAELYGAQVLIPAIQDSIENVTTFALLQRKKEAR